MDRGILIAETRHGFVCANAGVDASNVEPGFVTVLPDDPDASAERLRAALSEAFALSGRASSCRTRSDGPWREGVVNVALGVAGLQPLLDYRGCRDTYGRPLTSTVIALADELAGAAEIVTRKSAGTPVAIVRGAAEWAGDGQRPDAGARRRAAICFGERLTAGQPRLERPWMRRVNSTLPSTRGADGGRSSR